MAIFTTVSYTDATNLAPTAEDMVTWSAPLWQTNTVTITPSEIVAIRDGRKLILRGSFFETSSGNWDGTVMEVQIDWPASFHPAGIGRSLLTGVAIPLAPNVTVIAGALPLFSPNQSFNGAAASIYAGADSMTGGGQNDLLNGYDGNDTLTGGLGRDTLNGGNGDDLLRVAAADLQAGEVYNGGQGLDILRLVGPPAGFDFRAVTLTAVETLDIATNGDTSVILQGAQVGGVNGLELIRANGAFINLQFHGSVDARFLLFDDLTRFGAVYNGTTGADAIYTAGTGGQFGIVLSNPGQGADTFVGGSGNDYVTIAAGDLPATGPVEQLSFGAGSDTIRVGGGHVDFRRHLVTPDYEAISFLADGTALTLNASQILPAPGFLLLNNNPVQPTLFIKQALSLDLSGIVIQPSGALPPVQVDIEGTLGADSITGSHRADVIRGLGGQDSIRGGGGDDILVQTGGATFFDGGPGHDSFIVSGNAEARLDNVETIAFEPNLLNPSATTTLFMSSQHLGTTNPFSLEQVLGAAGRQVVLIGSPNGVNNGSINLQNVSFGNWSRADGDLVVYDIRFNEGAVVGSWVDDVVETLGGGGNVAFSLGEGDDTVTLSELRGAYTGGFDGGAGLDTLLLRYEDLGPSRSIDLTGFQIRDVERLHFNDVLSPTINGALFGPNGFLSVRSLGTMEGPQKVPLTIIGSRIDFTITTWEDAGRPIATHVRGTATADEVYLGTFEVTDTRLGDGNDTAYGSDFADLIFGDAGDDLLTGYLLSDTLLGDTGNDTLFGEDGNDLLFGWLGRDLLWGGDGNDTLFGEQDDDTLLGEAGADVLWGGEGRDILYGWLGRDTLLGEAGNDTLFGEQDNDVLYGWLGADVLWGGEGNDTLWGEQDNDTLLGETGNDLIFGQDGNDVMYGWVGNDTLYGWTGNDVLWGEGGNDRLLGEDGNDTFIGGLGRDTMTGGAGADRFFNAFFEIAAGEVDLITDYDPADRYLFQTGAQLQYFNFNAPGYGQGAGIHVQVAGGVYILDVFGATANQLQAQTLFF